MFPFKYPVPQTDPPRSPRETLPTMYDLPSEDPEEPGLPDEFHDLQPQLLTQTFQPSQYQPSQIFCGSDINLYYDSRHPNWYKRPDWFGVVGVSRLYAEVEMRLSYVVWQEAVNPFVVVELLSPGTEKEDLGQIESETPPDALQVPGNGQSRGVQNEQRKPGKWEVYERILRIPYYVVFSRYTNQVRVFKLEGSHYQELQLQDSRVWISDLDLGLGLWQGEYQGVERLWLRWYDAEGNWVLTEAEFEHERAEFERQRAEQAEAQLESLIQKLRESGIDPDTFLKS
ncbi:Uma2 family endonuclease [Kamptonema animale CS-326]|jgi:Uma2 family endonuclease|uniref:Uma2 family endonuclease n=1 Tax=Kamptonema animale TaxID=92934 RepID=UPI00232D3975|nr:Uma2 family endonuclease [Kamptonema animale]MDB9513264.1 Uma2 family endonuclease [Kamptonema animale CS-326]